MSPEKRRAHGLVLKAIRQGRLVRGSCETASGFHLGAIHGHHRNGYSDPLDVVWLCAMHHGMEHGGPSKRA